MPNTYLLKTDRIVDANGEPTEQFLALWNGLIDTVGGQGRDMVADIIDGTQTLTIEGVGDIATALTAQNANVEAAAASTGGTALTATASPAAVYGLAGTGTTVTGANGTPTYTILWTYISGDTDITMTIAHTTSFTPVFTRSIGTAAVSAVWNAAVTDSAGSPATYNLQVSVFLFGTGGSKVLEP